MRRFCTKNTNATSNGFVGTVDSAQCDVVSLTVNTFVAKLFDKQSL